MTRVSLGLGDNFADGIIAKRIVELANAGECNSDLYARAQSSNCAGICTGTDREIVRAPRPAAASDGRANFDDANYIIGRNV